MSQNKSHAVMSQRHEAHDSLDYFPTPLWATRALCEQIGNDGLSLYGVWEPACGQGHMARALGDYFGDVRASDIHPYGYGQVHDFLMPTEEEPVDWIVTNPPFRLAAQFIDRAHRIATKGVAMLVRVAFLEGVGRYNDLFSLNPPNIIAQFTERVPMLKGRVSKSASTATAYCWLVWTERGYTEFRWIPPCRKRLERDGDYEAAE